MKDKINKVTSKIRNSKTYRYVKENKKKVVGVTLSVFIVFIFTFTMYNLNNPTYFNKLFASIIGETPANEAFKDKDFYYCVVSTYNSQNNASKAYTDSLTDEELASITKLECDNTNYFDRIEDASGVEKLTNLTSLNLSYNNLTSIDLSSNTALTELDLSNNYLTSIDLSKNTALISLNLGNKNGGGNNKLTELDLSNNTALTELDLYDNKLISIDLKSNILLTYLDLEDNELTEIDLKNNTKLEYLNLDDNYRIDIIDLSQNINLTELDLEYVELTSINLSNNKKLKRLVLDATHLKNINLENNTELIYLDLDSSYEDAGGISSIDLNKITKLEYLDLSDNYLSEIDLSNNVNLTKLVLSRNNLTSIDLSKNTALTYLDLKGNELTKLDLSKNILLTSLHLEYNPLVDDILIQSGETYEIDDSKIILPEEKSFTYSVDDSSVASIDGKRVTALSEGSTEIHFHVDNYNVESSPDYLFYIKLAVGKVELEVYEDDGFVINNEDKYIYMLDTYAPLLLTNNYFITDWAPIMSNFGDVILEDNKIKVVQNGKTYLEYDFVYLETGISIYGYYDNMTDYYAILSYNSNPNKYNIKAVNCTYEIEDDEIIVKYKGKEIDRKKVMYMYLPDNYYTIANTFLVSSKEEKINVSDFKTITNINEIDESKINLTYGVVKEDGDGYFTIYDPLDEDKNSSIGIVNIISRTYDLSKDYIYLGNKDFIDDTKIIAEEEAFYGKPSFAVENNYLYLKNMDYNFDRWDLIKVTSEEYEISEDKIDLKGKDIDLSKINVTNAKLELNNDKLLVKYNDEVVKELSVVNKKVNSVTTTKKEETTKKETTTTSKNNESNVTTKKDTTTKKKTTTKKESIIDKIFKKDTTSKKEETTKKASSSNIENSTKNSKTNIFKKSTIKTTTKVEENNISNKIKNGIRMLKNISKPMIILLGLIGIILLIYIIILLNKKNKKDDV